MTSTVPYCQWLVDVEADFIELCAESNETEDEEKNQEKEDKVSSEFEDLEFDFSRKLSLVFGLSNNDSSHHLEIITPPPESISFSNV